MGLLDVLNGMQNGPRGPSTPSTQSEGGGMSPMTMAILALLAWKGIKHFSGNQTGSAPQPAPAPGHVNAGLPGGTGGGGLSDMLKGGLGGLLAGGAAGSILSGGLGDLLKQFQQKGLGDQADSWVGNGPNKQIAPGDLANALGAATDAPTRPCQCRPARRRHGRWRTERHAQGRPGRTARRRRGGEHLERRPRRPA